ncbi:MAG: DUF4931 domain-containing protein [bacterium]|nr:DUF4931 domain-containing protein [bacterium]
MADIRHTTLSRREVILATERKFRPDQFAPRDGPPPPCPFCPGNEHLAPPKQLEWRDDRSRWKLRVVPNKFPAVRVEGTSKFLVDGFESVGIADAHGMHDVLVETPDHAATHATLSVVQHRDILWAIHARCQDLRGDTRLHDLRVFKNYGPDAGASLEHPHTQIIGLPFIPAEPLERWNRLEQYYYHNGVSIFTRALEKARAADLIVLENDAFVCYCPYESRFPFEMWIMPKEDVAHFDDLQPHYDPLAQIISQTFRLLEKAVGFLPPFNAYLDEGPPRVKRNCNGFYRFRYRIMPRLSRIAGLELATGCFINTVPPEQAAKRLREVAVEPSVTPVPAAV